MDTTLKQQEDSSDTTDNKNYLIKVHEGDYFPIAVIEESRETNDGKDKQEFYVVVGQHRLSETFETLELAETDARRTDVSRLMQLMFIVKELNINK